MFLYVVVVAPLLVLLAAMGCNATVGLVAATAAVRTSRPASLPAGVGGDAGDGCVDGRRLGGGASHREKSDGRSYSFWPQILHGEVARSYQLDAAVQGISGSLLPRQGTIFGDATIVSAVALHSGRRVSAELADLNPNWLEAGAVSPEDVVTRIENDGVAAVITPPFGLVQNEYFKSYLFACYDKPKPFFRRRAAQAKDCLLPRLHTRSAGRPLPGPALVDSLASTRFMAF